MLAFALPVVGSVSCLRSVLDVFFTRLLVIPSLIVAPWLLTKTSSRRVQFIGFAGCAVINLLLAVAYEPLQKIHWFFITLYRVAALVGAREPQSIQEKVICGQYKTDYAICGDHKTATVKIIGYFGILNG